MKTARPAAIMAAALLLLMPVAAFAETGPVPPEAEPAVTPDGLIGPIVLAVGLAVLVGLAIASSRGWRPRWWRLAAAVLTVLGGALGAFLVLALGVVSDWTDPASNIPTPYAIGAAAVLGTSVLVAVKLALDWRRGAGDAPSRHRGRDRSGTGDDRHR